MSSHMFEAYFDMYSGKAITKSDSVGLRNHAGIFAEMAVLFAAAGLLALQWALGCLG